MSKQPNDDVRVQDNSISGMKTKKDQSRKTMSNQSKKASMGTTKKSAPKKRNVTVTNSVTKY